MLTLVEKNCLTPFCPHAKKYSFIEEPFAGVAQPVEQLICNQQVAGSSPIASSKMEGFPSGQRGQTVNLLAQPSEVQILPPPPEALTVTRAAANHAGIAQLAERQPSKLNVAGSIPVSRSKFPMPLQVPGTGSD
jgi:hypothetical protein